MRVLAILCALGTTAFAQKYVPPQAETVDGYFAEVLPCKQQKNAGTKRTEVVCKDDLLGKKSLRELAILRNTIYARYGWDGFRKEWLRAYFHGKPWFKANPKFTYKLINGVDKQNAHLIGVSEHSISDLELERRKNELLAKYKTKSGVDRAQLTAEDRLELGLLERARGVLATDTDRLDKAAGASTSDLLAIDELRQLSLRDLRILRNTIYARHGRPFKSQILQDHFDGMGWYKLNAEYEDKLLTKTDTRNIQLIKTVENEFGGPISDDEHLIEPAIDGA